ncbi:protein MICRORCHIDIA 2 isoform X1 [Daucus carota subsp. sativus]|uniref:protein MICRORCHIDIA 2 isoform X1 n=1 Tax=Daucus carota subsp. sativus TaxID=79200 RepID=UPI0007EF1634|nr:PREDICTED: protein MICRORCHIDIA 2-like isoform X1 [Daucus carota subsp. sativus]
MSSQRNKIPENIVILDDSSDDEDTPSTNRTILTPTPPPSAPHAPPRPAEPPVATTAAVRSLDSQSFWKAGAYEEINLTRPTLLPGELEHARVHPKFLHSNATSHKWAFGAIAELFDNAVDEINNGASFVKVDRIYNKRDNSPALLFQDDGGGMCPDSLRKCMSLGYSMKKANTTIGQYGNGFKTSTMRLGADVIVFSRSSRASQATQSVGLLSYTFLRKTGQDDVIVPMVDFDISNHWAEPIIYGSQDDWSSNLKTILEWSPFVSKDELLQQFEDIGSHGTKIIIYNLWLNDEGVFELSFDDDDEDIRLRDEISRVALTKASKKAIETQAHISYQLRFSLRAYASLLYLRKLENFKIILRGKPVEQYNIADELRHPKVVTYRPQVSTALKEPTVETTLGFLKEFPAISISGFNVYHKNRLIRPFWKVTGDGNSQGIGVVGVLEANFIEPAHDKQDFERSSLFHRLEMRLKQMQLEYWRGHCELVGHRPLDKKTSARTLQNNISISPPVEHNRNVQQNFQSSDSATGISANGQDKILNKPFIACITNPRQELSGLQPRKSSGTSFNNEMAVQPPGKHAAKSVEGQLVEISGSAASIDQICEENIQLFVRCEEHAEKEKLLKRTVEELEKELEDTRKKCAELSSHLERQRKDKIIIQAATT